MISYVDAGLAAISLGLVAAILRIAHRPRLTDARGDLGIAIPFGSHCLTVVAFTLVGGTRVGAGALLSPCALVSS